MDYTLSSDPALVDVEQVWRMLRETYWSPGLKRSVFECALRNSLVMGAYTGDGLQIGFARVVTDRATFAWLCDVIVCEGWRGRGVGRAMVGALLAHPELQTLRRWCLATKDAHGIYGPLGFTPVAADRWMEKRLPPQVWSESN